VALTRGPTVQKIVRSKTSKIPNGLNVGVTKFLARITERWESPSTEMTEGYKRRGDRRGYLSEDQIYTSFGKYQMLKQKYQTGK